MEQLLVILGVILWLFLRGASRGGAGRSSGTGGPLSTDQLEDSIEDAQERALKALERWEARQKAGGGAAARSRERLARAARARESGEVDLRRFEVAAGAASAPATATSGGSPTLDADGGAGAAGVAAARPRITGRAVRRVDAPLEAARRSRRGGGGLARLRRLPELQRALVFHELLQPPPALRPGEPPGPA